MTTITQKLADALCAILDNPESLPAMRAGGEALAAYDAQQGADPMAGVNAAHDKLSAVLEDPDAANDDVRDAAIDLCDALNALAAAGVQP